MRSRDGKFQMKSDGLHLKFKWSFLGLLVMNFAWADGPDDNKPDAVREIPPRGIEIDQSASQALLWRCKAIRTQWQTIYSDAQEKDPTKARQLENLEAEVLVFPRAVELALEFNQFYRKQDLESASHLLDEATQRISRIENGADWSETVGIGRTTETHTVIGGFRSQVDDSFQPYGVVIPANYSITPTQSRRLDIWFHGRGEKVAEVHFLTQQQRSTGQYTPSDTFVLHPYGRYCNAFKFAGEIDVLESLRYIETQLRIDPELISVRGFSMGGAGCWQFATHYPDLWFAANPGAGFAETKEFLNFFQNEDVSKSAPHYEQTLWKLYDCPPWSRNLLTLPTIAYSGEIDKQKQAADIMEESLKDHGVQLTHILGPNTAHKILEDSKKEIESRMQAIAMNRESRRCPKQIDFTTYSLRYHNHHWITLHGLNKHWEEANVRARINGSSIIATTTNVSDIEFIFDSGQWPNQKAIPITITIDGQTLEGPLPQSDQSWSWRLSHANGKWKPSQINESVVRKKPRLQGPIDDAFLERFIFVLPSKKSKDPLVENWTSEESQHAMTHWRKHFRGDIRAIKDDELTEKEIAESNLILFGDCDSNSVINQVAHQIPINWNEHEISIGNSKTPRKGHLPILIYPNPLNPDRYIVLNSGFTFREYDYLNNARQTPKLPDWALVDISNGSTTQTPGKVVHANFFNENWLPTSGGKEAQEESSSQ